MVCQSDILWPTQYEGYIREIMYSSCTNCFMSKNTLCNLLQPSTMETQRQIIVSLTTFISSWHWI